MAKTRKTVAAEPEVQPVQAVERPILCSPFEAPTEHWFYQEQEPAKVVSGRRAASYFFTTEKGGGTKQKGLFAEENREELLLINYLMGLIVQRYGVEHLITVSFAETGVMILLFFFIFKKVD